MLKFGLDFPLSVSKLLFTILGFLFVDLQVEIKLMADRPRGSPENR